MNKGQKANSGDVEQLVRASQAGDREAFDELVRLYQRRAMQAAFGILGSANDAAEAVQVGFVSAYLNIRKLKEPERFQSWLLRIVTNEAISQARAAKRRAKKLKLVDSYEDKNAVSTAEKQNAEELKEAIQTAMLKLSKRQAQAISLFGIQDLSHKEVAEIMGCSVGAAKWYVFSARNKLRGLLKKYME